MWNAQYISLRKNEIFRGGVQWAPACQNGPIYPGVSLFVQAGRWQYNIFWIRDRNALKTGRFSFSHYSCQDEVYLNKMATIVG